MRFRAPVYPKEFPIGRAAFPTATRGFAESLRPHGPRPRTILACHVPGGSMSHARRFTLMDGREICASSAEEFFERLREGEALPPADMGRYLDLLHSRGFLVLGVEIDVGTRSLEIHKRCERAMASLINHGWVRVSDGRAMLVGRGGALGPPPTC